MAEVEGEGLRFKLNAMVVGAAGVVVDRVVAEVGERRAIRRRGTTGEGEGTVKVVRDGEWWSVVWDGGWLPDTSQCFAGN